MIIHVLQQGETLPSIALYYGTSVSVLIQDNALSYPDNLVIGQCIVIANPELTYTVVEGDTLMAIANSHNISLMQLLQNNPFLAYRDFIYPDDRIVISYNKKGKLSTHGNVLPYINELTPTYKAGVFLCLH